MKRFSMFFMLSMLIVTTFAAFSPGGVAFAAGGSRQSAPEKQLAKQTFTEQANSRPTNARKAAASSAVRCVDSPSDTNCTNKDPISGGCSADAYTVHPYADGTGGIKYITGYFDQRIGEVDLRYSPKCKSNWSLLIVYCSGSSCPSFLPQEIWAVQVFRKDGAHSDLYSYNPVSGSGINSAYSNMVYAPTLAASAWGQIDDYFTTGYHYAGQTPYI